MNAAGARGDEEELFDGAVEIGRLENGASFGMPRELYARLARCANRAAGMGIEPAVIARLSPREAGCRLTLYGRKHAFLLVEVISSARLARASGRLAILHERVTARWLHNII